jgi:hypothetical protein
MEAPKTTLQRPRRSALRKAPGDLSVVSLSLQESKQIVNRFA